MALGFQSPPGPAIGEAGSSEGNLAVQATLNVGKPTTQRDLQTYVRRAEVTTQDFEDGQFGRGHKPR